MRAELNSEHKYKPEEIIPVYFNFQYQKYIIPKLYVTKLNDELYLRLTNEI